ncbi:uncharacterized protein LOC127359017 isoform X1 [Dicentrarchus labrax]|uniref:Ig-like domain-containing protein n=1 Tax=Dicentrarchus labrax TaxID=13489 RepID=A0A8P4K8F2_DICLA|nr:uncharacterized protein LOC127359017 isoform X1 [Dicentrarchus labrax]
MKASSVSLLLTPTDSPHPDNMKASSVSLLLTLTDSPHPDNMKASSVSLLLGVSVLLLSALTVSAVSLEVSPNRPQFFREESVCLKCVGDGHTADGWTVKRTAGGHNEDFGRFDGSCYIISKLSQSDTGVYWCGTSSGQKSNQINITVTNYRGVILELPALPVMTGSDVTLRCRKRGVSTFEAFFFKNGVHIGSGPEGQFTISKVQQSDEGLYWCFIERTVESPRSWLRVRGPPALTTLPLPPPPPVASSSSSSCRLLPSLLSPPPSWSSCRFSGSGSGSGWSCVALQESIRYCPICSEETRCRSDCADCCRCGCAAVWTDCFCRLLSACAQTLLPSSGRLSVLRLYCSDGVHLLQQEDGKQRGSLHGDDPACQRWSQIG